MPDVQTTIKWGAWLLCGHWAYGPAGTSEAIPKPGDPAHCERCSDWLPVINTVDTTPLQDSNGRT